MQFLNGLQTRPVITQVVHIGTFRHIFTAVCRSQLNDFCKQLFFAEIAAILRIFTESRDIQLFLVDDQMPDAVFLTECRGFIPVPVRERG